jgi:isopenicillin N synthase-like dioxygenase
LQGPDARNWRECEVPRAGLMLSRPVSGMRCAPGRRWHAFRGSEASIHRTKQPPMSSLRTFSIPLKIVGSTRDRQLARQLIRAWRTDGIFQVATDDAMTFATERAFNASRRFFRGSMVSKSRCVSDLSYSGYVASGEEVTAGEADMSEIFTVCKDVPLDDSRVRAGWPCHGPAPWPDAEYRDSMSCFMSGAGMLGESLLKLVALGLDLPITALTELTHDGWHHMRVLRFPTASSQSARGIGAHTDYGLLVIAAQDDVGGLYVRPPVEGEARSKNWLPGQSTAGMHEHEEPWTFVEPEPRVLTVFPGDILQFITSGHLLSTPHKVRLNTRERFAMAYFHEPNFMAVARPLLGPVAADDFIHYGTHFTSMFARCYPDRPATQRILAEGRLETLARMCEEAVRGSVEPTRMRA